MRCTPNADVDATGYRYASIGAVLMSKEVASGIRDSAGFWKHGHTYQVRSSLLL